MITLLKTPFSGPWVPPWPKLLQHESLTHSAPGGVPRLWSTTMESGEWKIFYSQWRKTQRFSKDPLISIFTLSWGIPLVKEEIKMNSRFDTVRILKAQETPLMPVSSNRWKPYVVIESNFPQVALKFIILLTGHWLIYRLSKSLFFQRTWVSSA